MCAQSSALPPCLSLVSCCPALLPALLPGTAAGVHRFRPLPRQALLQASDCSRLAELPSLYPGCWPQGVRVCRYLRVPGRGCRGVQQLGSSGCSLRLHQPGRACCRVGGHVRRLLQHSGCYRHCTPLPPPSHCPSTASRSRSCPRQRALQALLPPPHCSWRPAAAVAALGSANSSRVTSRVTRERAATQPPDLSAGGRDAPAGRHRRPLSPARCRDRA